MGSFSLSVQQRHALRRRMRRILRGLRGLRVTITFVIAILLVLLYYYSASNRNGHERGGGMSDTSNVFFNNVVSEQHHMPRGYAGDFGAVASARLPADSYPTPKALHTFVSAAVRYLVRANDPKGDGSFVYEYRLRDGFLKKGSKYNTLRHAGAIYALADACHRHDSGPMPYCAGVNATSIRAAKWLLRNTVAPLPSPPGDSERGARDKPHGIYGVWSKPAIEDPRSHRSSASLGEVRLGGLGLGLVGLTAAEAVKPGLTPPEVLAGIGRFATNLMQKPSGLFFSYYQANGNGPDDHHVSLYYPGEAALGLVRLYYHNGNASLLEAAVRGLEALHRLRKSVASDELPCDHWALIATANVFRTPAFHSASFSSRQRKALLDHAQRLALVCHQRDVTRTPSNEVLSSSFSTGLEGILAVLPLLSTKSDYVAAPDMEPVKIRDIFCLAQRTVGSLVGVQHGVDDSDVHRDDDGDPDVSVLRGAIPGSAALSMASVSPPMRRVASDNGIFRVDTTQHALSAVLSFVRAAAHPRLRKIKCSEEGPPFRVFRLSRPRAPFEQQQAGSGF